MIIFLRLFTKQHKIPRKSELVGFFVGIFFGGSESISFQGNPHKKRHRFALFGAKCVFLISVIFLCRNEYNLIRGTDMFRYMLLLLSYGFTVLAFSNCILYLNYRTLGYSWTAVLSFILQSVEFYVGVVSLIVLFIAVYDLIPSRSPSS